MGTITQWRLALRGKPRQMQDMVRWFVEVMAIKPLAHEVFTDKADPKNFRELQQYMTDFCHRTPQDTIGRIGPIFHTLHEISDRLLSEDDTAVGQAIATFGSGLNFTTHSATWDHCIQLIYDQASNTEVDCAYVHIGSELHNMEHKENCDTLWFPLIRDIGELNTE